MDWVACNLEFAPAQWHRVRERAAAQGVKVMPWVRLCRLDQGEDWETLKERLALLVTVAQLWGCDWILPNYENEANVHSPSLVSNHLYNVLDWDGSTGWSTQAWLPNNPDFSSLTQDPVLLQIFPTDLGWMQTQVQEKMGDCVAHARIDKGFKYVGVTYQTYDNKTPAWYDVESYQHSTFPGNVIGVGQWDDWYK